MAITDDVLPVAVRADVNPVPEMNALLPIAAVIVLLAATTAWRKRYAPA